MFSSSSTVTSTPYCAEESNKLNEKIKTLESENYHLTKELHVVKLEANRLKMKLNQFKDHMGIDLELLSAGMDLENNPQLKAEILKVEKLTQSVRDVSCQIETQKRGCTEEQLRSKVKEIETMQQEKPSSSGSLNSILVVDETPAVKAEKKKSTDSGGRKLQ